MTHLNISSIQQSAATLRTNGPDTSRECFIILVGFKKKQKTKRETEIPVARCVSDEILSFMRMRTEMTSVSISACFGADCFFMTD